MTTLPSVFDTINGRCSVRTYTEERIPEATIHLLLNAAVRAPSAMNEQPWQFVIVQEKSLLKKVSDQVKAVLGAEAEFLPPHHGGLMGFSEPGFNIFYDAGTLIVICKKTGGQFAEGDCWLAAENLMLYAHSLGLGSCVIGSAIATMNLPVVKKELGIPAGSIAVAPIILGFPLGAITQSARHSPHILARY